MARIWLPLYNQWADTEDPAAMAMLGLDPNGTPTWNGDDPQTGGTPEQYLPGGGQGWDAYQSGQIPPSSVGGALAGPPTLAEDPQQAPAPPATPPAPAPAGGTTGTAPNLGPFNETFQAPTMRPLPQTPTLKPAPQFSFQAPTAESAMSDPGYQFRLGQGVNALQRWAAAKGTLNDSGTANALMDYGQNAASQEYQNVWNRDYSVARDTYAPQFASWQAGNDRDALGYQTNAAWNQHANDMDYTNAWNSFLDRENLWKFNVSNAMGLAGSY